MADIDKVKSNLRGKGYYLQLPPPPENLLEQHKIQMKELNATVKANNS
jgi:uncharacterized protein YcgL (UPF0745 family)